MSTQYPETIKYGIGIVNDLSKVGLSGAQVEIGEFGVVGKGIDVIEKEKGMWQVIIPEDFHGTLTLNFSSKRTFAKGICDILIGKNAKVSILEHIQTAHFFHAEVHIDISEHARVIYQVVPSEKKSHVWIERKADVAKDAIITWVDVVCAQSFIKETITSNLNAPGAEADLSGLFFGKDTNQFDIAHHVIHNAPHTTSHMLVKGVLQDASTSIYRGSIDIQQHAKKSIAQQKEETLLLSSDAKIDAVPALEIATNDVQCSHGVSVTRLNQERLFYLRSRGIDPKLAQQLTIDAHMSEILDKIEDEEIRNNIVSIIKKES